MNKYLAELIGTFALVFCGCGAIIVDQISGGAIGHMGISTTFGLIITVMIYALGNVSGAHLNPAVSIAFWYAGVFERRLILPYVLSQCIGAVLASAALWLLFPNATTTGATLPSGSIGQSFGLEVILSFFLMFVIINVATGSKEQGLMAGLAIGFTVLLAALFGGPISGASMNPARSLAPALFMGELQDLWIYFIAPPIGTLLSIIAWKALHQDSN
ncbi:MAG: aquaporin [Bacteroidota bacterium]